MNQKGIGIRFRSINCFCLDNLLTHPFVNNMFRFDIRFRSSFCFFCLVPVWSDFWFLVFDSKSHFWIFWIKYHTIH